MSGGRHGGTEGETRGGRLQKKGERGLGHGEAGLWGAAPDWSGGVMLTVFYM